MDRTLAPKRHVSLIDSGPHLTADSPINGDAVETAGRKGAVVFLDVTVDTDTVSIVVKLQGYDETADAWYDIPSASFAALAAVGHAALSIYPSIGTSANVAVDSILPGTIRAVSTHTGGTTMTYSVQVDLIA